MSLLEDFAEYESASRRHGSGSGNVGRVPAAAPSSFPSTRQSEFVASAADALGVDVDGYITTTLDAEDAPIFSLDTVQFQVPNKIISLAVSNDVLVLIIEGAKVLRIKLQEAHNILEVDIPINPASLRACNVFLDPTGRHLLLSTPQGENFYHFEGWDQMKPLAKFKSMEVTAIAWNGTAWLTGKSSTKTVLFGTHDGKIYETELRPGNDAKSKRCDIPAKLVAELPVRERVTGMFMEA
ncbi:tethering complex subunit, partial [Coemansia sp. RSA 2599]